MAYRWRRRPARICPRSSGVQQSNGVAEAGAALKATRERTSHPSPRKGERRERSERIPLAIAYMLVATILFAGSSALSKWLVATYPIGEMLFVRAAAALIGSSLVILPATRLSVFRTKRLRDHMLRGISPSCAQTFLVVAFSLMPLATAGAINFSAPLFSTVAAVLL